MVGREGKAGWPDRQGKALQAGPASCEVLARQDNTRQACQAGRAVLGRLARQAGQDRVDRQVTAGKTGQALSLSRPQPIRFLCWSRPENNDNVPCEALRHRFLDLNHVAFSAGLKSE